jgi:hypothetical protein
MGNENRMPGMMSFAQAVEIETSWLFADIRAEQQRKEKQQTQIKEMNNRNVLLKPRR